ncbi:nuclear transport factor 2 family protein [Flavobacterium hauense]
MKKTLLLFTLVLSQVLIAQEADVKKSIATFFEGMHTSDTLKIKSVCSDSMILQSVSEGKTGIKLSTENVSEFYKSVTEVPKSAKIEERLLDYKIQIDGAMAHAWTPYEFYVNGKLSHKGVTLFSYLRIMMYGR